MRKRETIVTQDEFDTLLTWFNANREEAGRKYEEIRHRLIRIFMSRGCYVAEELADETMTRVCKRVKEIAPTYEGEPALYFYAVANNVFREFTKKKPSVPVTELLEAPETTEPREEIERRYKCLDRCLEKEKPENRELIMQYYEGEKLAKINQRKRMAALLGLDLNALRIRVCRIRRRLHDCMLICLEQETEK